jgi:hypothetical protein
VKEIATHLGVVAKVKGLSKFVNPGCKKGLEDSGS